MIFIFTEKKKREQIHSKFSCKKILDEIRLVVVIKIRQLVCSLFYMIIIISIVFVLDAPF